MSEHAAHIAKLVSELRLLTGAERADLKVLLAPGVAAVNAKRTVRRQPVRRAA